MVYDDGEKYVIQLDTGDEGHIDTEQLRKDWRYQYEVIRSYK